MAKNLEIISFIIENKKYAMPINYIERVIRAVAITSVPESPENMLGIFNLHGATVPVYNIRRRLGHPEKAISTSDYFIVLEQHGHLLAIQVDRVDDVQDIPVQEADINETSPNNSLIKQALKIDGDVILLINPESMFEQLAVYI